MATSSETTLNTYTHSVPDSQKRAVERVAGVLFDGVLDFGFRETLKTVKPMEVNKSGEIFGEPGRTRTSNPLIKSQLLYH